jgi:hypothetical protein
MAITPRNKCPSCGNKPDLPDSIQVATLLSGLIPTIPTPVFCNFCGAKLRVEITQEGRGKFAILTATAPPNLLFPDEPTLTAAAPPNIFFPDEPTKPGLRPPKRLKDFAQKDLMVVRWFDSKKKKIFISYSHKDAAWCKPFSEALKAGKLDVFFDDGSIGSGADWVREIGKHIDECDLFIVVLTPDAWASEWVQRELNTAFATRKDLVPMLLRDTAVSGFLKAVQWVDVRGQTPQDAAALVAQD